MNDKGLEGFLKIKINDMKLPQRPGEKIKDGTREKPGNKGCGQKKNAADNQAPAKLFKVRDKILQGVPKRPGERFLVQGTL